MIPSVTYQLTGSAAQQRQSPYLFLMNSDTAQAPHPGDWPNWALGQKARVQ
jgi:hypothetical protein